MTWGRRRTESQIKCSDLPHLSRTRLLHQRLSPPSLLRPRTGPAEQGKSERSAFLISVAPPLWILCYYHYYSLFKLKEKFLSFIAFSVGLSLCLKNFPFPSFRMICVPRLHSFPYFPWWIYAHHVPHFLSCVLSQFFSLHNQELSWKTLAHIWSDLMMIKPPPIRVMRFGVSNLWVLIKVLSFISQRAVLKLLYLYKAPPFLIKKVSIILPPS